MFESLKLYKDMVIEQDAFLRELVGLGYRSEGEVGEEGDFSLRGGIVDVYPATFECPIRLEFRANQIESIFSFNPITGKPLWEHRMVIVLPKRKLKTSYRYTQGLSEEIPLHNFLDLNPGDYVVHIRYGIGKFLGIERLKSSDGHKDYLALEYSRQDKLLLSVEQLHLIQKYLSVGRRPPRLSRLGTGEWQRTKERVKKGIKRLAWEFLLTQAHRLSLSGFIFSKDTDWQREFELRFPYQETPDQIKATEDVKQDMESPKPMDRLLCGDVGYGKTEVAMRATFKAVMNNKQVAFLVPTTILAEQHYQNFLNRLHPHSKNFGVGVNDFPLNVEMLSRFKTKKEQEDILKELSQGKVDVLIGTHRLLSPDVKFKDLGLVIIDEEQRFGVKDKEKLKHLRLLVDVLTLTATPIPRTLYMAMMGARDMSIINTPIKDRIPVKTEVAQYDKEIIAESITKELRRKGQVYFVHDRILDIEKIKKKIVSILPSGVRVALAHGRLPAGELERVMLSFLKGEIQLLICTTIIGSGIDVPNANTLIVNNAQDFGLADLHQLRGRVGRFNRQAYAYFLIPKHISLSAEAKKRLEAIERYSELGSGFKIASRDLEIRGAGNLLGTEQHGYITQVGFDLYCRLLRQAIKEIQNEKSKS